MEEQLKQMMCEKYGSLQGFANASGINYQTLTTIMKRGVQNATIHNVVLICGGLGISVDALADGRIVPQPGKKKDLSVWVDHFNSVGWFNGYTLDGAPMTVEDARIWQLGIDAAYHMVLKNRENA